MMTPQDAAMLQNNAGNPQMVSRIAQERGISQQEIAQALRIPEESAARYVPANGGPSQAAPDMMPFTPEESTSQPMPGGGTPSVGQQSAAPAVEPSVGLRPMPPVTPLPSVMPTPTGPIDRPPAVGPSRPTPLPATPVIGGPPSKPMPDQTLPAQPIPLPATPVIGGRPSLPPGLSSSPGSAILPGAPTTSTKPITLPAGGRGRRPGSNFPLPIRKPGSPIPNVADQAFSAGFNQVRNVK